MLSRPGVGTPRAVGGSSRRRSSYGASWATGDELASALDSLGWPLIYDAGDETSALAAFEEALEIRRELGDAAGETRALVGVCQVLVALGEVERAETISRELLERAEGDPRTEHFAYHFLADCALIRGDTVEAETRYRESLRAALPLGDVIETSFEVQGVAMAVAAPPESGLRLAASVEALRESLGIAISIPFWDGSSSATSALRANSSERLPTPCGRTAARSTSTMQSRSPSVRKIAG